MGFEPEDYADDVVEVWEVNLPVFRFFQRLGTRWIQGMNSVVGIRWEAVYPLLDRLGLDSEAWDQFLADLEVMERAALEVINKRD